MGKKREYMPHQELPVDLEKHLKIAMKDTRYSFLKKNARSSETRNEITASMLEERGIYIQSAGDDPHGTDALLFYDCLNGMDAVEPVEMKSCYVAEPGKDANKFEYNWESVPVYNRLIEEHQIVSTFRKCEDGLDRLVECYILPVDSGFHDFCRVRRDELLAGALSKKRKFSLNQMKEMGAVKLI